MITNDEAYMEGFNDVLYKKHKAINPYPKYHKKHDEWHNGAIDKYNELYPKDTMERAIYGILQLLYKNDGIDATEETIFTDYAERTKNLIYLSKAQSNEERKIGVALLRKLGVNI